jgi:hypothetical protein
VSSPMKRLDRHSLDDSACDDSDNTNCLALRRYPPPICLKSCHEAPFSYVRESVLFIGTQFSNLYTAVDTPTRGRVGHY